jgi:phosphatidylserine decarboxylase
MSFKDTLFILSQYLVPQHLLSRCIGKIAESRQPWIKNPVIKGFIKQYNVDLSEAEINEPEFFDNFNAFFTRALKPGARQICPNDAHIASPADGAISQIGEIKHGLVMQAKGQNYSVETLLGGDSALAEQFADGNFATIYLSPKDYHRVHMPYPGKLIKTIYVPGQLFSVNTTTAENVPNLFARNERLVCIFDTDLGPMAVILVGAMIVAGIETVWGGEVAPVRPRLHSEDFTQAPAMVELKKGDELGRFKLGSTAIVLFGKDKVNWAEGLTAGTATRMGETLAVKR